MSNAMVINGHGAKTSKTFLLNGHTVITPESLTTPYVFSVKPDFNVENSLRSGQLYPVLNGHWHRYQPGVEIPEVLLAPWKENEAQEFSKRLLTDQSLWSKIDNTMGLLTQRDPNACLVVRLKSGTKNYTGKELVDYCEKLKSNSPVNGTPIAFMSPRLGKIKILKPTSLSEILEAQKQQYGVEIIMLATCNADGLKSKSVHLETAQPPKPISSVFHSNPILNAWKAAKSLKLEPKKILEDKENASLNSMFKKLTI